MINAIMSQEDHDEDRFKQALAMIANLQAQAWAFGKVLDALAETPDVPDSVKKVLRQYGEFQLDCRRHIAIDQYPKG
jgi:hypothetical protein